VALVKQKDDRSGRPDLCDADQLEIACVFAGMVRYGGHRSGVARRNETADNTDDTDDTDLNFRICEIRRDSGLAAYAVKFLPMNQLCGHYPSDSPGRS
jgi:hypothetical protein